MNPEDEALAEDASGALAPYFPDYMGGNVSTVLQLVVFHAFLLVFAIKLVKWGGRAWFMGHTFLKDREIRVGNYDLDKGGTVSVGWPDQFWTTVKKSFRDWCWTSVPTGVTPFQKWIDDMSIRLDTFRNSSLIRRQNQERCDSEIELQYILDDFEKVVAMGIDRNAILEIASIKSYIERIGVQMKRIISSINLTDNEKYEECEVYFLALSHLAGDLKQLAKYGRRSQ